jgi:hypothetical protein
MPIAGRRRRFPGLAATARQNQGSVIWCRPQPAVLKLPDHRWHPSLKSMVPAIALARFSCSIFG